MTGPEFFFYNVTLTNGTRIRAGREYMFSWYVDNLAQANALTFSNPSLRPNYLRRQSTTAQPSFNELPYFQNIRVASEQKSLGDINLFAPSGTDRFFTHMLVTFTVVAPPTPFPTSMPTTNPTGLPTESPSETPTMTPTTTPTKPPTGDPSSSPTRAPTQTPSGFDFE